MYGDETDEMIELMLVQHASEPLSSEHIEQLTDQVMQNLPDQAAKMPVVFFAVPRWGLMAAVVVLCALGFNAGYQMPAKVSAEEYVIYAKLDGILFGNPAAVIGGI